MLFTSCFSQRFKENKPRTARVGAHPRFKRVKFPKSASDTFVERLSNLQS